MYIPIYLQVYRYVFSILRIENTNIALIFDQCIIRDIEDISIQACQQACYIGSTYANMCYWIAQQSCGIPCSAEIYLCKSTPIGYQLHSFRFKDYISLVQANKALSNQALLGNISYWSKKVVVFSFSTPNTELSVYLVQFRCILIQI